ncbi:MAG: ABC transporter permease [Bacillota bacterium]|nr:ABC transporter permease [Bacillota bacterium]
MKKYLNKALLLKEWKSIWWMMIPIFIFSSRINFMRLSIESMKTYQTGSYLSRESFYFSITAIVLIVILIIAALLICMDRKTNGYEILSQMPYSKTEIIAAKWFVGVIVMAIPLIIDFIVVTYLYCSNKELITTRSVFCFGYIWQYYIIAILSCVSTLTVFMFIQCITNNEFFGGVLGICFIMLPQSIGSFIGRFAAVEDTVIHYFSERFLLSSALIIILIASFLFLLLQSFRSIRLEEDIIMISKKLEFIFKCTVSISVGITSSSIVLRLLRIYTARSIIFFILCLVFIMTAYYVYNLVDRIIKLSKF